jgi:hypothetical protein
MNSHAPIRSEAVAVRHRATSAQPPHAISPFPLWSSSRHALHSFPSTATLYTPVVLLEGLHCCPAASPLPATIDCHGKNRTSFLGDSQ